MQLVRSGPRLSANGVSVYVDESIHDSHGFILTAFVFASPSLDEPVNTILSSFGFVPGSDEFKSGVLMRGNPKMQQVRDALMETLHERTKLAILITPARSRGDLGSEILQTLERIVTRNGLGRAPLTGYFDRGLVASPNVSPRALSESPSFRSARLYFEQDSRQVRGLQVADLVAHCAAQTLREVLAGAWKEIDIGDGPDGLPMGTRTSLGSMLLMSMRYSFFVRPLLIGRQPSGEEALMDPVVILDEADEDLIMEIYNRPELLGWGVFISEEVSTPLREASEGCFSSLWLGCMH